MKKIFGKQYEPKELRDGATVLDHGEVLANNAELVYELAETHQWDELYERVRLLQRNAAYLIALIEPEVDEVAVTSANALLSGLTHFGVSAEEFRKARDVDGE